MKVTEKEFKSLKRKYNARQLIEKHVNWKINLTSKQLDECIIRKNEGKWYGLIRWDI